MLEPQHSLAQPGELRGVVRLFTSAHEEWMGAVSHWSERRGDHRAEQLRQLLAAVLVGDCAWEERRAHHDDHSPPSVFPAAVSVGHESSAAVVAFGAGDTRARTAGSVPSQVGLVEDGVVGDPEVQCQNGPLADDAASDDHQVWVAVCPPQLGLAVGHAVVNNEARVVAHLGRRDDRRAVPHRCV